LILFRAFSTVTANAPAWETIIGLEIHAQLKAQTKLFSRII